MPEVVEINLITACTLNIEMIFKYIQKEVEIEKNSRIVEVMDNWEHENSYVIYSKEDLKNLINSKIVCITEKTVDGYAGLDIEKINDKFCYTIWFNSPKYDTTENYDQLIENFILFAKKLIANFILCAIGKEVIFEYQDNFNMLLNNSHNIDIWIYSDHLFDNTEEILDSKLMDYEIRKTDNHTILKKYNINMDI